MKRMIFEDMHELATVMLYDALNLSDCVSAICHYEMATALLSEIIQADVPIGQIDISDYEWSGYDKEYAVTLMDGNVYCNPLFGTGFSTNLQDPGCGIFVILTAIEIKSSPQISA